MNTWTIPKLDAYRDASNICQKEGKSAGIETMKPKEGLKITKSVKIWTNKGKEIPNRGKEFLLWKENWHPWIHTP